MKKLILLFFLLSGFALSSNLQAQDYNSAIGLRFGYPLSITYKTFISEKAALEAYAGYRGYSGVYNYFNIGAMYQVHNPFPDVDGLSWYYGGGISFLFFNYDFISDGDGFGLGINGVIGLDYKFDGAPINLSLDFMPTIRIGGSFDDGFNAWGALAARYTLN